MALAPSFWGQIALTLAASIVWAPPQIISDASVMAAAASPGDYGRIRSLASLAWALMAPVAGYVNGRWGIRAGIASYTVLALAAVPAALGLPLRSLRPGTIKPVEEEGALTQPLLPGVMVRAEEEERGAAESIKEGEEARKPSPLATALAIVRYIESITEMGMVAPRQGLYGFSEVSGDFVGRHLAPPELSSSPSQTGAQAVVICFWVGNEQ